MNEELEEDKSYVIYFSFVRIYYMIYIYEIEYIDDERHYISQVMCKQYDTTS